MNLSIADTMSELMDDDINNQLEAIHVGFEVLNGYIDAATDVGVSEESLKEIFEGISNTVRNTRHNIINLFKLGRNKYKTDIDIWLTKEKRIIQKVEEMNYDDVKSIKVDYPTGMNGDYSTIVLLASEIFTNFEKAIQLELVSKTTDSILSSVSKNSNSHEQVVRMSNSSLERSSKPLVVADVKLSKLFKDTTSIGSKKPFSMLFDSMEQLKTVRHGLAAISPYVGDITKVEKQCQAVEDSLDLCTQFILDKSENGESNYVPSKQFLLSFASFIKQLDSLFIIYGKATIRTMAVSHNLAYVYKSLYQA
jgi:hypothetical protein